MSLGYKKITGMLEEAIMKNDSISDDSKKHALRLCTKIYMLESSTDITSKQRLIDEVKGEIGKEADNFKRVDL